MSFASRFTLALILTLAVGNVTGERLAMAVFDGWAAFTFVFAS